VSLERDFISLVMTPFLDVGILPMEYPWIGLMVISGLPNW
jgi:hypothetical protein